jgi:hypothetical protein
MPRSRGAGLSGIHLHASMASAPSWWHGIRGTRRMSQHARAGGRFRVIAGRFCASPLAEVELSPIKAVELGGESDPTKPCRASSVVNRFGYVQAPRDSPRRALRGQHPAHGRRAAQRTGSGAHGTSLGDDLSAPSSRFTTTGALLVARRAQHVVLRLTRPRAGNYFPSNYAGRYRPRGALHVRQRGGDRERRCRPLVPGCRQGRRCPAAADPAGNHGASSR